MAEQQPASAFETQWRDRILAGAARYDRARHLPRLCRIGAPDPGEDVIGWLEGEAASLERRYQAGHWSYDLGRHVGLLQALTAERALSKVSTQRMKETVG